MKTLVRSLKMSTSWFFALAMLITLSCPLLAQEDRMAKPVRVKKPIYFGYEIAIGTQFHTLESNISKLQKLYVVNEGGIVGVRMGNKHGVLRANVGLYYTGGSMYSIDMLEGGISGNLFLLGLKKTTSHTFEPYALVAIKYQRAKFFGNYPRGDGNNSTGAEADLGTVSWYNAGVGLGVEFQLRNEKLQFLHFFAEGKYGIPFFYSSSNDEFSQTHVKNPLTFALGATFGKFMKHKMAKTR